MSPQTEIKGCEWMGYLSPRKKYSYFHFQFARLSNDHQAVHVFNYNSKKGEGGYIDSMFETVELHIISIVYFKVFSLWAKKLGGGVFMFFFSYLPC